MLIYAQASACPLAFVVFDLYNASDLLLSVLVPNERKNMKATSSDVRVKRKKSSSY